MFKQKMDVIAEKIFSRASSDAWIEGVATDSRLVKEGNLYFALKGERVDGHDFIPQAIERGAKGLVVEEAYSLPCPVPLIKVPNVLEALQVLASNYLKTFQPKIVAVTGSLGKTTTKEFIVTLLKKKYRVGSSPGNHNSQVGLPLTILNHLQGNEEAVVLEMGMTHLGQIERLVQIAPPLIAVLTTIEAVHQINFSGLEFIADAKSEIFSHPLTRVGIFPYEIPFKEKIQQAGTCQKLTYSAVSQEAQFCLKRFKNRILVDSPGEDTVMFDHQPLLGIHNDHNMLAAITCAKLAGLNWYQIEAGLQELQLPERRLERVERNGMTFINDSYNAATSSVCAALTALQELAGGERKIAVLGDMLEMGQISRQEHQKVGEKALECADYLFCFGKEMYAAYEIWKCRKSSQAHWFSSREELSANLKLFLTKGDHVLLKGSRGMETWKVIDEILK